MTTREDVLNAYRWVLGREPESEEVVRNWLDGGLTPQEIRAEFLKSEEFTKSLGASSGVSRGLRNRFDASAAIHIDLDVSAPDLQKMIRRIEGEWEKIGVEEPHWSVLTKEEFKQANLAEHEKEFFRSGSSDVHAMELAANRAGIDLGQFSECFELGCGVGRVTLWLARRFRKVIACDISEPHLELARRAAEQEGLENITFTALKTIQDMERLPRFDAMFSVIVLQHNPPPVIAHILRIILDKLLPGGIAYFQVPTYQVNYSFSARDYLLDDAPSAVMEMHLIPQGSLFGLIEDAGCDLIEIREEDKTGDRTTISNNVLVRKR